MNPRRSDSGVDYIEFLLLDHRGYLGYPLSRYVELLFPSSPHFPFIKVKIQNKSNQPFQPSFPSRRCRHRQKTRNFLMSPLISQRLNKAFIHAPVKLSLKNSLGFRRKRKLFFYLVCSRFSKM